MLSCKKLRIENWGAKPIKIICQLNKQVLSFSVYEKTLNNSTYLFIIQFSILNFQERSGVVALSRIPLIFAITMP